MSARGKAFVRRWFAENWGRENLTAGGDLRLPYNVGYTLQDTTEGIVAEGEGTVSERFKILIVDDEPFNVDYLKQELEDLGYQTVIAATGPGALLKAATEAPDLILLDILMPDMDGFTVCRILKEQQETQFIPVIIMTALGQVADRIKGIEAGADDFLTKPVNLGELMARIHMSLRLPERGIS